MHHRNIVAIARLTFLVGLLGRIEEHDIPQGEGENVEGGRGEMGGVAAIDS
jgi:hypothetical protein